MNISDNSVNYSTLRAQFPYFVYEKYHYINKEETIFIEYYFNLGDKFTFKPTLTIPKRSFYKNFNEIPEELLQNIIFNIGMVELISYWKAACPPTVIIKPHTLTKNQILFWKKLYYNGLGEFFYLNNIKTTQEDFMNISIESSKNLNKTEYGVDNSVIVPIGGGKDSVVSLELLKESFKDIRPLILNPRGATLETSEIGGFKRKELIEINRTIDPLLLQLNNEGFLNGHTPFSALLAFVTLLAATISGKRNIALSNESSANEATVENTNINHQYSKSYEFEKDFREYVSENISDSFNYFSFLRPLSELQIAKLFATYPKYFNKFKSCNAGSKTDSWCGNCPKCMFAFIILSPFIDAHVMEHIFGKDLFNDIKLLTYFNELIGISEVKPFECVGTVDEVNIALKMIIDKRKGEELSSLLKYYSELSLYKQNKDLIIPTLLTHIEEQHFVEYTFLSLILNHYKSNKNSILDEMILNKNILILGFGKEGRSTYNYLRERYPNQVFSIADKDAFLLEKFSFTNDKNLKFILGSTYLDHLNAFDLIIKTPGISVLDFKNPLPAKEKITSQTDIFLKMYHSQVIGVTGTKGKSTTANLIYHILKKHKNVNVLLVGNMGFPPFDQLIDINKDTLIVFELSSHQLENITVAPHISVLLNLFQEHLDHYHSYIDYQLAKFNIAFNQNAADYFIFNFDNISIKNIIKEHKIKGKAYSFSLNKETDRGTFIKDSFIYFNEGSRSVKVYNTKHKCNLKGEHNLLNIMAAINVCKIIGVKNDVIIDGINTFKGLEHRLEYVGRYDDIEYYNDSIATIPEATMAAIKSLKRVNTLLIGGFDRGIDYNELAEFITNSLIGHIIFIGEAGKRIFSLIDTSKNKKQKYIVATDFDNAVEFAQNVTCKDMICLLSPAAASYDMFKNFEERGKRFKELVKSSL